MLMVHMFLDGTGSVSACSTRWHVCSLTVHAGSLTSVQTTPWPYRVTDPRQTPHSPLPPTWPQSIQVPVHTRSLTPVKASSPCPYGVTKLHYSQVGSANIFSTETQLILVNKTKYIWRDPQRGRYLQKLSSWWCYAKERNTSPEKSRNDIV